MQARTPDTQPTRLWSGEDFLSPKLTPSLSMHMQSSVLCRCTEMWKGFDLNGAAAFLPAVASLGLLPTTPTRRGMPLDPRVARLRSTCRTFAWAVIFRNCCSVICSRRLVSSRIEVFMLQIAQLWSECLHQFKGQERLLLGKRATEISSGRYTSRRLRE